MRTTILFGASLTLAALLFAGCQTEKSSGASPSSNAGAVSVAPAPVPTSPPAAAPAIAAVPVRINAGASDSIKDATGKTWIAETGFVDGDVVERPDLDIANTQTPAIYRTEHYSMESFSYPVPNGKYTVKLHFCETFEGITGPGERVFSFNVEGKQFNDFDVWVKAGGALRAYVETVPVEVKDGKLDITFTPKIENPQINAIEILPAS